MQKEELEKEVYNYYKSIVDDAIDNESVCRLTRMNVLQKTIEEKIYNFMDIEEFFAASRLVVSFNSIGENIRKLEEQLGIIPTKQQASKKSKKTFSPNSVFSELN